jgi:hypothetical protein
MTNDEKKAVHLAQVRHAQEAIHGAVAELRNNRPGLSFQSAWSTLQKTRPSLFDDLDKASDALSKITRGENEGDPFWRSQGLEEPVAKNNVPEGPTSRPHPEKSKDPRIGENWPQNPTRPKDSRIQGVATRPQLRVS